MARRKRKIKPQRGWAIYLRTSDKDAQNPENSQRRQKHAIENALLANSDLPVIGEYVDNLSGRFAGNRAGYQQMLEDARAGKFSHVAAENAERFGRNDAEALPIIDELHDLGVSVRFADYPDLDPVHADDRIMVSLSFTLARRESMKIGERAKGGMHAKLRAGGYCGVAPDGYINCEKKTGSDSTLKSGRYTRWIELDPKQAKVWRLAWDLLLTDRYTVKEIAEELHARGYRFRSGMPIVKVAKDGKRIPQTARLGKIFHNWAYAGWVISKTANIPPKTVRGQWEAIITTEEMERGLLILNRRSQKPNNHYKHHYLLKGIAYLQLDDGEVIKMNCQRPNSHRRGGGTPYYSVNSARVYIGCGSVDEQVHKLVEAIRVNPELIPIMREHYTNDVAETLGLLKPDTKKKLEAKIAEIDREEERTLRLYAAGRVTDEIWNNLWRDWQDRRRMLLGRMESLDQQHVHHVNNLDAALTVISEISVLYKQLDLPSRKKLLRDLAERVVMNTEGEVIRMELLPPFAYLTKLAQQVEDDTRSATSIQSKTPSVKTERSSRATLCVPDGSQSEHVASLHSSKFLQQLSYPQLDTLKQLANVC